MGSETKATMRGNLILEALNYDIEVPCPLQWALLWVFNTNKPQQQVREEWNKSGQIQGHGEQRNRGDV